MERERKVNEMLEGKIKVKERREEMAEKKKHLEKKEGEKEARTMRGKNQRAKK